MITKINKFSGKWNVESGMRNVCYIVISLLFPLSPFLFTFTSCADLEYTEETTRDEAWTYD